MKVLILGASGKTGSAVVERALAKGHEVTVLVRDSRKFTKSGVEVLTGDATKRGDVVRAMKGQDAVIESIGGTTPYKATSLETASVQNIIHAMQQGGARRLVVVSMMGIGESRDQAPFWYRYLLMPTFLHGSTKDKTRMEEEVMKSGLSYVIARPPILTDEPATGTIRVIGKGMTGHSISRADLANFLVDQLEDDSNLGRAVTVVNK
ncbi:SDR family oxidoreductase [soil metagenome]